MAISLTDTLIQHTLNVIWEMPAYAVNVTQHAHLVLEDKKINVLLANTDFS